MIRKVTLPAAAVCAALAVAACSSGQSTNSRSSQITVAGSTALLPLVKQAALDYQGQHAGVKISVSGGGSRVGIAQAAQGGADIGDSDIAAPSEPALVDHEVAVVTFAVVTNPAAGVKNLTTSQIRSIFSGKTTNFNQVGGKSETISIINRPKSSGTRAVFVKVLMGGQQPSSSGLTQDSSGTVAQLVGQTPGAISYVSIGYVKPGRQVAVSIDGVAPNDANVETGKYKFWSYEHMLTKGQPRPDIAAFIDFVAKDKPLLRQLHFVAPADMKEK